MNSKLLYAATLAVSLISTLAMADEAPLTRAQVNAETQQAIANGTLRRTDYDDAASIARQAKQHAAGNRFAQRFEKSDASSGN